MAEDSELERKAVEELLTEAKRGKTRAETMGAMGWMKCPLASTNKRFLINTIKNTLHSPKDQEQGENHQEDDDKESEPNQSREETKPKRHRSHPYKPSFRSRRRVSSSPPRHHRNRNQHSKDKNEKRSSK